MNMAYFFIHAGEFTHHTHEELETGTGKAFRTWFHYKHGTACYDEHRVWSFSLEK